jgi:hypothetical protein
MRRWVACTVSSTIYTSQPFKKADFRKINENIEETSCYVGVTRVELGQPKEPQTLGIRPHRRGSQRGGRNVGVQAPALYLEHSVLLHVTELTGEAD